MNKKNQGITLIALVVTIIILLILVGISISMLTGQNGILNRATEAKEKNAKTQENESTTLTDYEKMIDKYTSNLPASEYTMPYLPDSTKFEMIEKNNLSTGLVIREKATGSEYVWVEVPKTDTVYSTSGRNITSFTDDEYTKIENDLHTYTSEYRNGNGHSDTFYDASNDENEADKSDWYQREEDYKNAKKKMLKSVYQNGGFWVGRYEAGIEKNRTASGKATIIPLSKKNLYPYNYVTRTQAKVLAERVESGSYASSLMFGVQWDLVLKYIETKKSDTVADIKTKLNSDSTLIGNYKNNLWSITNEKVKYSTDSGSSFKAGLYKKESEANILLTTGTDESFQLMNIYDIAGNVWEWTLERYSDDTSPCAIRGGSCGNNGAMYQANYCGSNTTSNSNDRAGFRISIY